MSKKVAIVAGVGALGCFGMIFVVVLLVGGIAIVSSLEPDPVQPQAYREQPVGPGTENPGPGDDGQRTAPVSETVTLQGRLVDHETQQGIQGAYFILLTPGKTYADFQRSSDARGDGLLEAGAVTDGNGDFQISDVRRGYTYTIVAAAPGYQIGQMDHALEITPQDPEVTQLNPLALAREM